MHEVQMLSVIEGRGGYILHLSDSKKRQSSEKNKVQRVSHGKAMKYNI